MTCFNIYQHVVIHAIYCHFIKTWLNCPCLGWPSAHSIETHYILYYAYIIYINNSIDFPYNGMDDHTTRRSDLGPTDVAVLEAATWSRMAWFGAVSADTLKYPLVMSK